MSEPTRTRLQVISVFFAIAATVTGWVWVLAGDRRVTLSTVDQHEFRLKAVEAEQRQTSSQIAEIRADVRWIRQLLEQRHVSKP